MICLVTAGPTYEPLDSVRRLTNFSTGELGIRLSNALVEAGHTVVLLLGQMSTCSLVPRASVIARFGTTEELSTLLQQQAATTQFDAVFHAAAVSDFRPSRVLQGPGPAEGTPVRAKKIPSGIQSLWVELIPTPKLICRFREWFPDAWIVGWKYAAEGSREEAFAAAWRQILTCRTDACVLNGPSYGQGFALLQPGREVETFSDRVGLAYGLARECSERARSQKLAP
ncbi:MAG: phosphopantothenoylcysteine decarboxylase [Verrucomicrobiota bacterium]|nr:phosphopantothenoylcysteine decarboxylase [Limisphaera sp.]MDW8382583.1 phosphopantothenoylcysteine decarboxylase [Verrucomicrobiota bacterium]